MATFDSFRAARWLRTLNLVLQAVLFLSLFSGLNYLARHHPSRLKLDRRFTLSPETLSYVQHLSRPITVVVTLADPGDNPEVRGLLAEYVHAAEATANGQIEVKYID